MDDLDDDVDVPEAAITFAATGGPKGAGVVVVAGAGAGRQMDTTAQLS